MPPTYADIVLGLGAIATLCSSDDEDPPSPAPPEHPRDREARLDRLQQEDCRETLRAELQDHGKYAYWIIWTGYVNSDPYYYEPCNTAMMVIRHDIDIEPDRPTIEKARLYMLGEPTLHKKHRFECTYTPEMHRFCLTVHNKNKSQPKHYMNMAGIVENHEPTFEKWIPEPEVVITNNSHRGVWRS